MATCAELLEPIWTEMGRSVLESPAIFTDDTTITIARGSAGKSRKGRMWIYLDQRDQHYYDFTETREQARPLAVLCGYTGYIHADAYPGYDAVFGPDLATEVACWAHTRRKFVEAENTHPDKAKAVIDRIRLLYAIETRAKDEKMSPQLRLDLRRRESVPLLTELREYLGMLEGSVLPKSPLAKAVGYAQRQWKALNVYTTDGRLEIDNNTAERAMRPVAVGRKGWLFVQSVEGGQRAAILLSLVMTAKAIGINPVMYLRDLLVRISVETDVRKLTPHGWAEHYAEQVSLEYEAATARLLGR